MRLSLCRSNGSERQQRIDPAIGPSRGLFQGVLELGGFEQTLDRSGAVASAFRSGKEPVAATELDWPDGILDEVVVDWQAATLDVTNQCRPALQAVVDGARQTTVRRFEPLGDQPVVQGGKFRQRLLLPPFKDRGRNPGSALAIPIGCGQLIAFTVSCHIISPCAQFRFQLFRESSRAPDAQEAEVGS